MAAMSKLELRWELQSSSCSIATYRDVVLVLVHTEITAESLKASTIANQRVAMAFPRYVGCLTVVNFGVKIPDAPLRKLAAEAMAATHEHLRCAAQVLQGEGFWPSTVRSIITAVERLRPDDRPRRTFSDVRSAIAWMAENMDRDSEWQNALNAVTMQLLEQTAA
jgi:hypothetical protein